MRPSPGPHTALCGVILHPAAHTRSPAMHNAAFAALGLDAVYVAFDVPPARLRSAVEGARALAVSLPHKEAVLALCDEVDETARRIGAANTLTALPEGRLRGDNTDWIGLVRALERATSLAGRRAVVLGAGGTARAAVFGLKQRGARVWVLNRTRARAEALAQELDAEAGSGLEDLEGIDYELLVHTTRVGLREDRSPVPIRALRPESVVFDAVYDPPRTRLLCDAAERGARTVAGKWMLVEQAAEQIRLWSGREAPREVMAEAFERTPGADREAAAQAMKPT